MGAALFNYTAYGLVIQSEVALPELLDSAEERNDVTIRIGRVDAVGPKPTDQHNGFRHQSMSSGAYFCWEDTASFLVRKGSEIVVDPKPGAEEAMIRVLLLGVVMAVLLHQRGLLVLHASAVVIDGGAVAFLGAKGWGKSTLAAAMYARGHLHLADDIVAIKANGTGSVSVLSGYPQLKLWPNAAASSLAEDPDTLPRVAAKFEKRARGTADRFSPTATSIRAVYALSEGAEPQVRILKPQEAILQLIGNSYMTRFGDRLLTGTAASHHLRQCARIATEVRVHQLVRPDSLELLPTIARLLESHLNYETSASKAHERSVEVGNEG